MKWPSFQDSSADSLPEDFVPGEHLWAPFHVTLWVHTVLLAALMIFPADAPAGDLLDWLMWVAVLSLAVAVLRSQRPAIHDLMIGTSYQERTALGFLMAGIFIAPSIFDRWRIVPHGLLWCVPPLLLMSVTPSLTRLLLACTLAGGWCAAYWVQSPPELALLLAFAVSWLVALGMVRLAFVADRHGLGGWRPVARLLRSVATASLPASVAFIVAWTVWPRFAPTESMPAAARNLGRLGEFDIADILVDTVLLVVMVGASLMLLYWLRRWLIRGGPPVTDEDLLPGQSGLLEFETAPPPPRRPRLPGLRGRVARMWGRWAAAMGDEGHARAAGETAAEYVLRLASELPEAAPPPEMTALLHRAHYSPETIRTDDLAQMQRWVQTELRRQKQRRAKQAGPGAAPPD